MPLPWKKTKITHFSQIVADLQSAKHGGSLVVETGFPTSLIDLFVKNRSRFQKRNSKKHLPMEISDPQPLLPAPPPSPSSLATSLKVSPVRFVCETVREDILEGENSVCSFIPVGECREVFDPMPSRTPSNSADIMKVSVETRDSEVHLSSSVPKDVHKHINGVDDSGRVLDRVCKSKPNMVLATVLNLIAMLVLILSVKKLIVGIILSAFLLLLFEFVGKRTASCLNLKPCRSTNKESRSLVSRVSCSFWFQAEKMQNYTVSEQKSLVHEEEIEVVQATGSEIDIRSELNSINRDQKLVCPEIEEDEPKREVADECKLSEGRRKGKDRAELKSKMMTILVPRKLRATKKKKEKKSKSKSEVLSSMEGVKSTSFEIEDQENVIQRGKLVCVEEEEKADYGTSCSMVESGRTNSAGNSECILIILIALFGLVGGRTLGVLFTMAGCFMIKMLKRRLEGDH
ncbi:uncharacterized protein LOC114730071 isoform X2 [Neltuma alba]|uniref:uncharacterized protein LOC114730071 isoform X2 n=1 Tax=Neltuma alba TaxID=207710 RepID=UPI0010A38360|nr:uncharacterized protein LOC114730071 isoform X2 [Prosopis alba]